ncbi:Suppressor of gene silencing protein [Thalictrum thalictroides]|uniref:Suppressor of gene silencing protein n=1 Tax=Thalictrum thalictroides TaxID=46969 RepID=A0A7J6VAA7_THATH|nr:Suppressor of gene silencing protein [Thalictrum thalictroides]
MNSRKGGVKPSFAVLNSPSPSKGKSSSSGGGDNGSSNTSNVGGVDQLSRDVGNMNISSTTAQDDGDWEVFAKKKNNRSGGGGGNGTAKQQWGTQSSSTPNSWVQPNAAGAKPTGGVTWQQAQKGGDPRRSNGRGTGNPQPFVVPAPTVVAPPLQHGWQWGARSGSFPVVAPGQGSAGGGQNYESEKATGGQHESDIEDEDDELIDDEDDDIMSDGFDSDESTKSHETRKKHKWFKDFFGALDKLTVEELNDPLRQWHCPACKNGPGAIDWYRGLQPLMAHAKTKGARRVELHRELAEILDEELYRRGTSVIPAGEAFGKWEGLRENVADREIVWPPMVVVMNTQLGMDENDEKWLGMGNQELLDYFSGYKAVKARHAYGPKGHRGMSLLIFESSAMGYHEAERLHKHFTHQGTDRYGWESKRVLFYPGGKRQLYGYMARKEDVDNFNKHCQGKTKLKFELRSYIEMVVVPMRQMSEDNQQLVWLKNKVVREQMHSKALEESFGMVTQKLRKTMEENRIVRQRTKLQHEQNKEEMDYQEQFYKEQMDIINQTLEEKEKDFEEKLQKERNKVKQLNADPRTQEDDRHRQEEIAEFIESQDKGIEEFEAQREKLIKMHEDKKAEMKREYMEKEIQLEKEFESSLSRLMDQYAPCASEKVSTTSS